MNLVRNGSPSLCVENPAIGFAVASKAGEYDNMSDAEYQELTHDHDELNAIWRNSQRRTAGDVLLDALRMTIINSTRMTNIVEALAESSARSDYLLDPEQRECVPSLREIYKARQMSAADSTPDLGDWSPRAIYDYICQRIRGQDEAKKAAAMVIYNHVEGRRSNAVFCGPSGCGKSEIWRHLEKDYPRVIRLFDASRLSAEGWKGSLHLRDIFEGIPAADLKKRGLIVVLDEADKICCETVVGAGGTNHNAIVQGNLLKMLDGDIIEFGAEDGRKAFAVDCSRVSVVLLGAFETLLQNKSRSGGGIGFGAEIRTECDYNNTEISYDDLIDAGMRREIAGRINRIVSLHPLTAADYKAILTGPVLDDLQTAWKCKVEIDDQSAEALAEQAVSTGLGVRWMKSQVTNALDDMMFDNPAANVYPISISPENSARCTLESAQQ